MKCYVVDAFAEKLFEGNPAASDRVTISGSAVLYSIADLQIR
ncbi:hypothetical protein [Paenibacillus roseipurpureus]|uniref:Uncharacterized protein n=1 Tax=Paenibacillus roseopurpureus TaxID=2918901 RepID=A0AA96LVE6_9BACL|nr:hypothetical protein [Paenibacillus sp. MBLB1832]WNR46798.1 hypothetical protein MJB10_12110 [Paenibacillus sp. MBLB1832]